MLLRARIGQGKPAFLCAALLSCGPSGTPASSSAPTALSTPGPGEGDAGSQSCLHAAGEPQTVGRIDAPEINEASGIVASAMNPDVFWVHNDSGDTARGFAVNRAGRLMATLVFDAKSPIDVEDIAIEDVAPNESFLYFGDIGDNGASRTELTVYRVAEPKLSGKGGQQLTAVSDKMRVSYPDGSHDAETLLFDPLTKDLLIATKKFFGAAMYRAGPFRAGAKVVMERIASPSADFATGGDISRDGRVIAIRNYTANAFVWTREPGETLAVALSRRPCRLPIGTETQGEALGLLPQGTGYVTVGEGRSPDLHITSFE